MLFPTELPRLLYGHPINDDEPSPDGAETFAQDPKAPSDFHKEKTTLGTVLRQIWVTLLHGKELNQEMDDRQGITRRHQFPPPPSRSRATPNCSGSPSTLVLPTNGTQITFQNFCPGKENRLLLWTKIVHTWPVGVLYVDHNVLPNDAQNHIYPTCGLSNLLPIPAESGAG